MTVQPGWGEACVSSRCTRSPGKVNKIKILTVYRLAGRENRDRSAVTRQPGLDTWGPRCACAHAADSCPPPHRPAHLSQSARCAALHQSAGEEPLQGSSCSKCIDAIGSSVSFNLFLNQNLTRVVRVNNSISSELYSFPNWVFSCQLFLSANPNYPLFFEGGTNCIVENIYLKNHHPGRVMLSLSVHKVAFKLEEFLKKRPSLLWVKSITSVQHAKQRRSCFSLQTEYNNMSMWLNKIHFSTI